MKKEKKDIVYPRFIKNKPCGEDLFENGSHKEVAQNIVSIIQNNGVKIIGIEGGWGAGKSNLVEMIKNQLPESSYRFFVYDSWGHQTDFQRRSILENLTSFLVEENSILNKRKWNGKLLQLLSRKRSVGTKIVKELSPIAKVGSVLAVLYPLLVLFSGFIPEGTETIIFWLAIFIVAIVVLLWMQVNNLKRFGEPLGLNILLELFKSYIDYKNVDEKESIEQSIKYETIYDEEPSTRDFKNWMNEIDKDLKDNHLIIVFDNMDRLPKEKVQELWASINTFFAEAKYDNITVIVPFDREHIKSAFKNEDIGNEGKSECYGNDFINKTFDVVYRVSPPIMSDWKKYFILQWKDALGVESDANVLQIFDLLNDKKTPREIISFINEFVSIKQISDTSIPDQYIALFIIGKDSIAANPMQQLIKPTFLGALTFKYGNDENCPKYMSALYYQLPVENALDIVYVDKVKRALDNDNENDLLQKLVDLPIFEGIVENAITQITNIPNAVSALNKCLEGKYKKEFYQKIWDDVYKMQKSFDYKESKIKEYQTILLQNISDKNTYLKSIVGNFYESSDFNAKSFCESVMALENLSVINKDYLYSCLKSKLVETDEFIAFLEVSKEVWKNYKISCEESKLDEYFSNLEIPQLGSLNVVSFIKDDFNLNSYKERLSVLIDSSRTDVNNLEILFNRLKEVQCPVQKNLADQDLTTHLSNARNSNFFYDILCMRLAKVSNFRTNNVVVWNNILSVDTDEEMITKTANVIEHYMTSQDVLLGLQEMNQYPFYKAVAKKMIENNNDESIMSIEKVLPKYVDIIESLDSFSPDCLIEYLNGWSEYAKNDITVDNVANIPIKFFEDGNGLENELMQHCRNVAMEYLKSITLEDWENSIKNNSYKYQLVSVLKCNCQNYFDAVKNLLLAKAKGEDLIEKTDLEKLLDIAEFNSRNLLDIFNAVRDCFTSGNATMTNSLFVFFGEVLLEKSDLIKTESTLRTIFVPTILDEYNNVELILKYKDKMKKIVENAKDEGEGFKAKVQELVDSKYKENEEFKIFAKSIGVELNKEGE